VTGIATRPRSVLCVTEHEHRSLEIADGVLSGRFTVAGETHRRGIDPDWREGLPEDEEWWIEWVKFAWGLDLAYAAERTYDPAYQYAWERLTASWIRKVPPDADAPEVTARRILNWIYAWQRFCPEAEHAELLLASLADQVEHVRANLAPARNHRTLELYALLIAGLAFPELELAEQAIADLGHNLATDFHPDGVHREASTHYHAVALRSFLGARANARRHGLELPPGFEERVARAQAFLAHCTRPDGTLPALSDADTGDYSALLDGHPPERNASFCIGGYHVQRSGWDRDAHFLIFDCGPLGDGGHGHYDALSLEAHAYGRPLVLDPGRGSYSEAPPNRRRWFRSTAAHNTVTVDGLDQTPYTRGRPSGPTAQARFLGRTTHSWFDVLAGEVRSPVYEAVHVRRIAFVADRYWLVDDRLEGEREHRFDLRYHLAPGAARIAGTTVLAPGAWLSVLGADELSLEPGWIAPRYGEYLDAPVLSAVARGRNARFLTLLAGEPARLTLAAGGVLVEIGDRSDILDPSTW
jgi:uncharacterized heparinase superfamily protein